VIATEETKIDAKCVAESTSDELATALCRRVPRPARRFRIADE